MTKDKPSKSPATVSLVKTVAEALDVNVKRSERLQAKRQVRSQVSDSHLNLSSSEVVTDIGHADGFNVVIYYTDLQVNQAFLCYDKLLSAKSKLLISLYYSNISNCFF